MNKIVMVLIVIYYFKGMGVEVLTQLNDEYSKSSILTFGVTPYSNRANKEVIFFIYSNLYLF